MSQAACAGIPYLTAWSALVQAANVQENETVLITGTAGSVGRAASQIAHWKQARVIGVGRRPTNLSAGDFVDSQNENVVERVKALTGGKGVEVALDTVGGPLFEICLKSLGIGGRQVAMTAQGDGPVQFNVLDFYHNLNHLIGVDTVKLTGDEIASVMAQLRLGFEGGHLHTPEMDERPFEQAIQVYKDLDEGRVRKKQVLVMK
jgi:NADPH:quinone reductase